MAPTKKESDKSEKEAKLTPEQSASLVLDYLRKQNRPYSATDISANLKNRVTKAAAAKLLKDMHERKEIEGRAAGKQIVYHATQDEADDASTENLEQMASETSRLRDETSAMKAEEKVLRTALRDGTAQVPLPELKACVQALEQEKIELTARLAKLAGGSLRPVSIEERDMVYAEHKKWTKTLNARTKIRADLWMQTVDMVGKDKARDVKEELGLEF